jgi:hypothetical protein
MSCDGFFTIVSSRETLTRAVQVVEGRTTVVVFFGLSSSLKEKHLTSRIGKTKGKRNRKQESNNLQVK